MAIEHDEEVRLVDCEVRRNPKALKLCISAQTPYSHIEVLRGSAVPIVRLQEPTSEVMSVDALIRGTLLRNLVAWMRCAGVLDNWKWETNLLP